MNRLLKLLAARRPTTLAVAALIVPSSITGSVTAAFPSLNHASPRNAPITWTHDTALNIAVADTTCTVQAFKPTEYKRIVSASGTQSCSPPAFAELQVCIQERYFGIFWKTLGCGSITSGSSFPQVANAHVSCDKGTNVYRNRTTGALGDLSAGSDVYSDEVTFTC